MNLGKGHFVQFVPADLRPKYPRHGWALFQSHRVLFLPIGQLLRFPSDVRQRFRPDSAKVKAVDGLAFHQTIAHLVAVLRELRSLERSVEDAGPDAFLGPHIERLLRASEMAPFLVELGYIYTRRLADRLAAACRPVLFEKYGSVPLDFVKLRRAIRDDRRQIGHWIPLIDVERLTGLFDDASTGWFDVLRDPAGNHQGIRDKLEHMSTLLVASVGDKNGPRLQVSLTTLQGGTDPRELLLTLRHLLRWICKFWTEISRELVEPGTTYGPFDAVPTFAPDRDTTGFWPAIDGLESDQPTVGVSDSVSS